MQRAAQIDGKLAQRLYIESVRQFFGKGERTAGRIKVLASGKGLKDDEVLYPGQNGQEIIEEQARARICMRLKDDKESAAERFARRLQRGRDLARMMGIVGDQFGAVQFSQPFEAAANAAKAGQSHRRQRRRKAALFGDRRGSERIVDVVLAVNMQADAAARLAMNIQCKGVSPPGRAQAQGAHVDASRESPDLNIGTFLLFFMGYAYHSHRAAGLSTAIPSAERTFSE